MRGGKIFALALAGVCLAMGACAQIEGRAPDAPLAGSAWVKAGADGKLQYAQTPAGDRIMDFSYAGYHGGGVKLPEVAVVKTISPWGAGKDDTQNIQAALDAVGKMPLKDGFRGAVLLAPGDYTCTQTLVISSSGVVLRGSASSGDKVSTLMLSGRPHLGLSINGGGRGRRGGGGGNPDDAPAPTMNDGGGNGRTQLAAAYTPSGTMSITVKDGSAFHAGDWISIRKPVTAAWTKFMGMDDMVRDGRDQTWIRVGTVIPSEREVTAVSGNALTVDVPLSDSYDLKYFSPPGVDVVKIPAPAQISESGIEHLHIQCPPQEINHTEAHYQAMHLGGQDLWAQDVIADETMNSVSVTGRRITLSRVSVIRKAMHLGASKPAEFAPNGTQVLLDRCCVSGDNVWFSATGAEVSGPIVLLDCTFRGNGHAEAHQRWTTGVLYDNCFSPEGGIEMRNRGSMGSGHGWGVGWGVIWNCDTKTYIVQNPPGAVNWLIGSTGDNELSARPFDSKPMIPAGTTDSQDHRVSPRSLYLTQLEERLGKQALLNIGYNSADDLQHPDIAPPPPENRKAAIDPAFGPDLALDHPVTASNTRDNNDKFGAGLALDGDPTTYWATDDGVTKATFELDTEGQVEINAVRINEALRQRIKQYKVEGEIDTGWKLLCAGEMITPGHVEHFPAIGVWKVRLTILDASAAPAISEFEMYRTK